MKVIFCALALVLLCGSYYAHAQFCTASGDPHIKTFDNAGVHFQGYGGFKMAETTNGFRVDGTFLRIGATVTAVRSITAQLVTQIRSIKLFTVISHGNWPGTNVYAARVGFPEQPRIFQVVDPVYIKTPMELRINNAAPTAADCNTTLVDGVNVYVCNLARLVSKTVRIGTVSDLTFSPRIAIVATLGSGATSRLTIQELTDTGAVGPVRVEYGRYYIGVQLPSADPYISKTNGLCGFFDGLLGSWEFINSNNTNMVTNILANRWYANAATNSWGWSFSVPPAQSLTAKHFGHLMNAADHHVANAMPNIDLENKLVFQSLDDLRTAETVCQQQVNDDMFVPPCVFDVAAMTADTATAQGNVDANGFADIGSSPLNAYSVAFSNVVASEFASSSSSSSGMSSATVATICLGAVALVGMLTMVVTFFKLRHVRSVIQLSSSSSSNTVEME